MTPKKNIKKALFAHMVLLEIQVLLISAHCSRIWDILACNISVNDPVSVQMNYSGIATDPFWVFIAGVREYIFNTFYFKGLRPSITLLYYFIGLSVITLLSVWHLYLHFKWNKERWKEYGCVTRWKTMPISM